MKQEEEEETEESVLTMLGLLGEYLESESRSVGSNSLWHMDDSLPGSSIHGILQATLNRLPFSSPGYLPDLGIKSRSPTQ